MIPEKFTYPFCYSPHPMIVEESVRISEMISSDPELEGMFSEGKMLGVMMVGLPDNQGNGQREGADRRQRRNETVGELHQDGSVEERGQDGDADQPSAGTPEEVHNIRDGIGFLYGFSGNVGGRSMIEGFVPPIYDLTDPEGHYKKEERRISLINKEIASGECDRPVLSALRKELSEGLQKWIFEHYVVENALGEKATVLEVFARKGIVPPGGTGDCAAPKMLQFAYSHSLKPLAMGEFWYGASPGREVRRQGCFYPSCTGKCGPLLEYMLKGLEVEESPLESDGEQSFRILYEDTGIIVTEKPGGMLSVPGRTGKRSLLELLQARDRSVKVYSCHRLDMDTSGLMVFARSADAQKEIMRQFEEREVEKTYIALLTRGDGPVPESGTIDLPLMTDWYDRPRQKVEYDGGKESVTQFTIVPAEEAAKICSRLGWRMEEGETMVRFTPLTGRSHQLRVHSAHILGLGRSIKGDRLYGSAEGDCRLHLYASSLSFTHPSTGKRMFFDGLE